MNKFFQSISILASVAVMALMASGCEKEDAQGSVAFYIPNAASTGHSGVGCSVQIAGNYGTWFQQTDVSAASIDCESGTSLRGYYVIYTLPNGSYPYVFTIGHSEHKGTVTVKGNCTHVTISY